MTKKTYTEFEMISLEYRAKDTRLRVLGQLIRNRSQTDHLEKSKEEQAKEFAAIRLYIDDPYYDKNPKVMEKFIEVHSNWLKGPASEGFEPPLVTQNPDEHQSLIDAFIEAKPFKLMANHEDNDYLSSDLEWDWD